MHKDGLIRRLISKFMASKLGNKKPISKIFQKYFKDKKYHKFRDHCYYTEEYRGTAHSVSRLKCSVPKKVPIVFHNGSYYGYHFIIKELTVKFKKQCTCLGKNT